MDATTVSYVTTIKNGDRNQNAGSTQGGTLLYVYGRGFARNAFSTQPSKNTSNRIKLLSQNRADDCQMLTEEVTDSQLACYTPALPEGSYQVKVFVNDNEIQLSQYPNSRLPYFISTRNNTPLITTITPMSGLPRRIVSINGDFKTYCYLPDVDRCSENDSPIISR